jgi:hypothetical protein
MQCKLCLQDKPLIGESHIIPKQFFHKAPGNIDKAFGSVKPGDKANRLYSNKSKSKQIQSGIHVPDILCEDCEQKLGVFDNYAQTTLLREKKIQKNDKENLWKVPASDFNYRKFKLFVMSVLWRSQICEHSFFSAIKLTSDLEAELRDMIIKGNPDSENKFSVVFLRYPEIEANTFSVYRENQPCERYKFRLGHFTFMIKVGGNIYCDFFKKYMLKPQQDLLIPLRSYKETKEYHSILDNIEKYKA